MSKYYYNGSWYNSPGRMTQYSNCFFTAWSYSENQSVKKNDLLFITESPFTRIFMVVFMILQIISRLLTILTFAFFWNPGDIYIVMCAIMGHMLLSAIIHIVFSEDLVYWHKGEYGKFLHNVLMNSLANIYFHNYLRMDERPEIDRKNNLAALFPLHNGNAGVGRLKNQLTEVKISTEENEDTNNSTVEGTVEIAGNFQKYAESEYRIHRRQADVEAAKSENQETTQDRSKSVRGIHISTFFRQLAFDALFLIEMAIVCQMTQHLTVHCPSDNQNAVKERTIASAIISTMLAALGLKIVYYCCFHIWSSTIFLERFKIEKQEEIKLFGRKLKHYWVMDWEVTNVWILGKIKPIIRITLIIIPEACIGKISEEIEKIKKKVDWFKSNFTFEGITAKAKTNLKNMNSFRKLVGMLCFFPILLATFILSVLTIGVIVFVILLLLPFMLIVLLYNIFATHFENKEEKSTELYIDDLPKDCFSKEAKIVRGLFGLNRSEIQEALKKTGCLDLNGQNQMEKDELHNLSFVVLSQNSMGNERKELNMNDTELSDEKLQIIAPMIAIFHMVKLGGKQNYSSKGLEKIRDYAIKSNKLERLEIHGTARARNFQFATKVKEEIDKFEEGANDMDKFLDGVAKLFSVVKEVSLDNLLDKFSAIDQVDQDDSSSLNCFAGDERCR